MTIRLVGALLCGAALILATSTGSLAASSGFTSQKIGKGQSPGRRATTVKSSKSNAGDLMGPPMGGMIFFGRRRF